MVGILFKFFALPAKMIATAAEEPPMPLCRPTGSDQSIRPAAATRLSGAFAIRPEAHAHMTNSRQARLVLAENRQNRQEAATDLLENDVAAGRGRTERPRFARLHASIAERQLDWAWHNCPDSAKTSGESEPSGTKPTDPGFSARALWLGGIALALLAAGIISAVATLQSSRSLPFETWARLDLLQRADGMPDATPTMARGSNDLAVAPEGGPMAKAGPVAARDDVMAALAGVVAAHEHGEADAALASHARLEPSPVEVAGLGPILANAAAAEQVAANLAMLSLTTAGVVTGAERLLREPPRPVFKPALLSSLQRDATVRPSSRP